MQTFKGSNDGTVIIHKSDLSDCEILVPRKKIMEALEFAGDSAETIRVNVSGKDLLEFVADYIRDEKISELEDKDTMEILMGK